MSARRDRQHGLDALDSFGDGLFGAAGRLDGHGLEVIALGEAVFVLHAIDLKDFATEADHQRRPEIGMGGVAPLRAAQDIPTFALGRHAATGAVHERHHAIDARKVVEDAGAVDRLGDELRNARRTIHRGEHADIVARAGLAVRPQIALKGGAQFGRQHFVVLGRFGEPVIPREVMHADIVHMHPIAGRDRLYGKADDLPVFTHRLVRRDGRNRHFVPAQNPLARTDAANAAALRDLIHGDNDIVVGGETNGARVGHKRLLAFA